MANAVKPIAHWPRWSRTPPSTRSTVSPARPWLWQLALATAISLGLWFMVRRLDGHAMWEVVKRTNPSMLVLAAALALLQLACRAMAWKIILSPVAQVSYGRAFRYTLAGAAASSLAPGRAGEALRVWLLKRDKGIPMPTSAAVAVVERILDCVAMLIVLAPLPWLLPGLPAWVGHVFMSLLVLAAALLIALAALSLRFRPARWFSSFQAGLGIIRRPARFAVVMLTMAGAWLFDLASVVVVLRAVGLPLPSAAGLLILLAVNAAILVPVMPAGLGAFELGALTALAPFGVPAEQGLAFASLYHLAQVLPVLALALVDHHFVAAPQPASGIAARE
jgi:glycosyltransferase 2 family protein